MNTDSLAGSRGRPVRIVLGNAVDGLLQDINEFVLRWIMGIQTVNMCIGILGSGSCRRTDPSVCADNRGMIAERNAVASEGSNHMRGLVVFRQVGPVYKVDNVGINGGPFPIHVKAQGVQGWPGGPIPDTET